MKIYYYNDLGYSITVQVNGQLRPSTQYPGISEPTVEYFTLWKQTGAMFEVDAPEGAIPYVKQWAQQVLLTYVMPAEAEQLPPPSHKL